VYEYLCMCVCASSQLEGGHAEHFTSRVVKKEWQ
jgi:hypothetical protein